LLKAQKGYLHPQWQEGVGEVRRGQHPFGNHKSAISNFMQGVADFSVVRTA
jgi:hypothetical protein